MNWNVLKRDLLFSGLKWVAKHVQSWVCCVARCGKSESRTAIDLALVYCKRQDLLSHRRVGGVYLAVGGMGRSRVGGEESLQAVGEENWESRQKPQSLGGKRFGFRPGEERECQCGGLKDGSVEDPLEDRLACFAVIKFLGTLNCWQEQDNLFLGLFVFCGSSEEQVAHATSAPCSSSFGTLSITQ